IKHKFIALDTPTRELLKEKNRALEDMVNSIFLSPRLSHDMWGKVIISATYLLDKIHCSKANSIVDADHAGVVQDIDISCTCDNKSVIALCCNNVLHFKERQAHQCSCHFIKGSSGEWNRFRALLLSDGNLQLVPSSPTFGQED
ncbi:hypothetical protein Tco_0776643, partial [Tanacetum coccineum]